MIEIIDNCVLWGKKRVRRMEFPPHDPRRGHVFPRKPRPLCSKGCGRPAREVRVLSASGNWVHKVWLKTCGVCRVSSPAREKAFLAWMREHVQIFCPVCGGRFWWPIAWFEHHAAADCSKINWTTMRESEFVTLRCKWCEETFEVERKKYAGKNKPETTESLPLDKALDENQRLIA